MKSLSPNAQEFVPFNTNNSVKSTTQQASAQLQANNVPLILLNSDKNAIPLQPTYTNPIIHGYIPGPPAPQYIQYSPAFDPAHHHHQAAPVIAFNSLNDLNNYVFQQQQQQQQTNKPTQGGQPPYSVSPIRYPQPLSMPAPIHVQSISPTQSIGSHHDSMDKTQLPHTALQASIIPIASAGNATPAATSATTPAFYAVPTLAIQPNYIDPNAIILNPSFSDNFSVMPNTNNSNKMQQSQPQQQAKRVFANSKTILNNNNNNNKKPQNNKLKQHQQNNNFEISNDKEWPSLTSNEPKANSIRKIANSNANYVHNNNSSNYNTKKKVEQDEDDYDNDEIEEKGEQIDTKPKTPYLEDETKLKKLIKNVDFIKKTIEEHYNLNERKFSFKDAVLSKPVAPPASSASKAPVKKASLDNNNNNKENITTNAGEQHLSEKPETKDVAETTVTKKKHKRSRRKNSLKKQDTLTDGEEKKEFDLNKEDFPDLATNSGGDKKDMNISKENEKISFHSDAYSSDATLDATSQKPAKPTITATVTVTALKKPEQPVQSTSGGKKLNKPIVVEFANMISALEKGDSKHNNLKMNKQRSKSQINVTPVPTPKHNQDALKTKEVRSLTNPLDSCPPTQKRGKEREKPKQKKPSTLKKIILKEREEKRLLREQQANLNANTYPLEILDTNSPIATNLINPIPQPVILNDQKVSLKLDEQKPNNNSPTNENKKTEDEEESDDEEEEEESEEEEDEEEDEEEESDGQHSAKVASSNESKTNSANDANNNNLTLGASNPMSPISQGSPISLGGYTPTTYATLSMIANDRSLLSLEKLEELVKQKIHNKKFREYCNQIINKEIDEVCSFLLHEIVRFQDRLYHKNPAKAKSKRRYVMGIREVTKHLKLHKLKCVILAPNCEKIQSKGGLDDAINLIIQTAMEQNVPFVFALGRKGLGKAVNKLVPISVVGIFDYSGAEEYFKRLVDLANNAKLAYQEIVEEYEKEECENLILIQSNAVNNIPATEPVINAPVMPSGIVPLLSTTASSSNTLMTLPNTHYHHHHHHQQIIQITHNPIIPSHMGHSRNSSTGSNISIEPFAYHMNYSHSRSASGNFNFGQANTASVHGHSRSASGGNSSILNIDFSSLNKHWTHSRTPSNCSNISFISRLSEPISEVGSVGTLLINNSNTNLNSFNSASNSNLAQFYMSNSNTNLTNPAQTTNTASLAAFQYYTEQVRQEMRENKPELTLDDQTIKSNNDNSEKIQSVPPPLPPLPSTQPPQAKEEAIQTTNTNLNAVSSTLGNLHLGCISEIDAGNEADTEADLEEKSRGNYKSVNKNETSE